MSYKLYYFNITGLGEPVRFILSYGGVKFEDIRLTFDDWPKMKSEMPMGQMPVLEIDGKKYNQSKSICRYLAKKFNLYGANDLEALEIDAAADDIDDMRIPLSHYYWEKDPNFKAVMKEKAMEKYEKTMKLFEEKVKKNGGFFVGGKMSWADLLYCAFCDYLSMVLGHDINKNYPAMQKLRQTVVNHPSIKAYIEKRPKTDF
ncbi:glutathione S-transferase-like [Leptopilina boulardi]|uniref:glutathione S-transferase-like n=1 Tax=Leptopilina boulardi TaxID=63433 RepID=UPI0021F58689|nr:glutathione S-transferase-like [Leptopilina boulardi]